jgi:hypothetical protein
MKTLIICVLMMALAVSCSSVKVSHDFDKTADFASYKTYAYTKEALALPVNELNRTRLLAAIDTEMGLKGFTKSETPNVLIDLKLVSKEIQTATANTSGGYGGYGYGAGYRYGWGGGFSTTTINYDSYQEGTLFIDMIDAVKSQLVWQGRGIKTIEPEASAEKREKNINSAVKLIFMNYPPKKK